VDWLNLKHARRRDHDLPKRAFDLQALAAVRDGTMYDHLNNAFADEKTGAGEYVPMSQRRPSAKTNLCRTVVSDSVSLLFSEYHFPTFTSSDETTQEMLEQLAKHTQLNAVMIEAAIKGSIGSVAIWLRVLQNRPYFQVLESIYLTPTFDPNAPDTLIAVLERYKVDADDLIERGYNVKPHSGQYWWQRKWDTTDELWFHPKKCGEGNDDAPMQIDTTRSTHHGLGFCPLLWVKNLPNGPNEIDGACTFATGIDTVIECDYLLSQGGRGLKYASDPTLVISGEGGTAPRVGGSSNALVLEVGDAHLLEISGGAAGAVLDQVKYLRELALEAMHGLRATPERIVGATSGKAIEMLHHSLITLADNLRISYGEGALVSLAQMTCKAASIVPGGILIAEQPYQSLDPDGIGLRWAEWFQPTPHDALESSQALQFLIANEVISRETATRIVAPQYDIEDMDAERTLVDGEATAQDDRAVTLAKATKPQPQAKPASQP